MTYSTQFKKIYENALRGEMAMVYEKAIFAIHEHGQKIVSKVDPRTLSRVKWISEKL